MRILCLYIPHLAVAVETLHQPDLRGKPIVVGGYPHERKLVFDCSSEETVCGIRVGMPLREAQHLCADAVFLPCNEAKYTQAFERVVNVLDHFSPKVEPDGLGRAFLDASGLEKLFGPPAELAALISTEVISQTGLHPSIGMAGSKFVARVAAEPAPTDEPLIIDRKREREFLSPLPVGLLPLSKEAKRRLELLGLRTVGQIASLPMDALTAQFGEEGLLAHRLAKGIDDSPLIPRVKPAFLEEEMYEDYPFQTVQSLQAALGDLLDRLIPRLRNRNQVCGQVGLWFRLDDNKCWQETLSLKRPTDSKEDILRLLRGRLDRVHFPTAITGIKLALSQLGPEQGDQKALLLSVGGQRTQAIGRSAKSLQTRFGRNLLKRVVQLDPDSRIPERRSVLLDVEP